MGLLERVSTLMRANLNDMIDRAEDPDKMIKQVILDMENQYLQVKTQVAVSIADQHMLEKKLKENEDTGNDWMRKRGARSLPDFVAAGAKLPRTGRRSESASGNVERRLAETGAEIGRSKVKA